VDNIFENVGTQNAGSINSDGLVISRNQFIHNGLETFSGETTYGNFIDLEPNTPNGRMRNVVISNNTFNGIIAPGGTPRPLYNGIVLQGAGVDRIKNIIVENNSIIGAEVNGTKGINTGISGSNLEDSHIRNNNITGTLSTALLFYNASKVHITGNTLTHVGCTCGLPSVQLVGVNDSIIRGNNNVWSDSRCNFQRPTGRQHLDIYVTLVSFPLNRRWSGKLTSVTVLRGCRPRPLARSIVSLPNIALERNAKRVRSTLTLSVIITLELLTPLP
jgi:hypothetical protein